MYTHQFPKNLYEHLLQLLFNTHTHTKHTLKSQAYSDDQPHIMHKHTLSFNIITVVIWPFFSAPWLPCVRLISTEQFSLCLQYIGHWREERPEVSDPLSVVNCREKIHWWKTVLHHCLVQKRNMRRVKLSCETNKSDLWCIFVGHC